MSEDLSKIDHELTSSFIHSTVPDNAVVAKTMKQFANSLNVEKINITEVGEDKLVSVIESDFKEYSDSMASYLKSLRVAASVTFLQNKYIELDQQLMLLSQMNEKAIELKTNDAKIYANKAWIQMAVLGTFCFLIALSFTYSFASYFNERFFQLHNGIKEIVSSNYGQRLHFEGKDEFYEIALAFNEMAEKLNEKMQNIPLISKEEHDRATNFNDIEELKRMIVRIKMIEEQAQGLISKYDIP
jgi:methyl-accepting chemotaxis protein